MPEKKLKDQNMPSRKEMLDQMTISANQYLDRALPEIKVLADGFYQGPSEETWKSLLQLLEGIQWLLEYMNHLVCHKELYANGDKFREISANLQNQLHQFEEALKSQDATLMGDILHFEVILILESAKNEILMIIDKEGIGHDLN
ncbi:hypothetical protein [Candidatus Formimonas warabiya]|uniref:Uncharacterized protein n=1 Tax=Formimonas warabiya TaxID=1761012 RepID=A0A3G1KU36_FORW1|nr:hypothetical protein [Candidatus Formimonas warabiya]ATW25685.1 hypothetical protein DCMF_13755 [Candidatus Formimonas warabiya]